MSPYAKSKTIIITCCIVCRLESHREQTRGWSNPYCNLTFWEAPLSKPRSHKALFPVGSSSTSSLVLGGSLTYKYTNNIGFSPCSPRSQNNICPGSFQARRGAVFTVSRSGLLFLYHQIRTWWVNPWARKGLVLQEQKQRSYQHWISEAKYVCRSQTSGSNKWNACTWP